MDSSSSSMAPHAQYQLSSFLSLHDDDELAQQILEELSFSRQSYAHVIATMTSSPSCDTKLGLNSISEDDDQEE